MAKVIGPKTPAVKTIKRLFALSSNRCAFHGCSTPLIDPTSGSILGVVCHIKGDKPTAIRSYKWIAKPLYSIASMGDVVELMSRVQAADFPKPAKADNDEQ